MRDEDFNRMFATRNNKDPGAWVILVCGVVAILCLVWLYALTYAHAQPAPPKEIIPPYSDEDCDMNYGCRDIVWELVASGNKVIVTGLSEEECVTLKRARDAETEPFVDVTCRPRFVVREES